MSPIKWLISVAGVITSISILIGAVGWAADTRYQTLIAQAAYVQKVSSDNIADDIRQLKRDIKRLELKDQAGNASPEDRAFIQYLLQDLEALQQTQ